MRRFGEEELIAYHLGELSWWRQKMLQRRLKTDAELTAESEEIAATLDAFSTDAEPSDSGAAFERSWQRVRGSLGPLELPARRRSIWIPAMASVSGAAAVAMVVVAMLHMRGVHAPRVPAAAGTTARSTDAVTEDAALAIHLNTAERVLTEVGNGDGPLQPEVRGQVHRLLLGNAVYQRSAEQHGDMGAADVIDELGRVLTSLDAEPAKTENGEGGPRMEASLSEVRFDLRVLSHGASDKREQ